VTIHSKGNRALSCFCFFACGGKPGPPAGRRFIVVGFFDTVVSKKPFLAGVF
jgi:hypothetical protein